MYENTIYSNLTGWLLVQSYKGIQYICVTYINIIDTILMHPIKSHQNPGMAAVFISIYNKLRAPGHQPKHRVLDNECSLAVQHFWIK